MDSLVVAGPVEVSQAYLSGSPGPPSLSLRACQPAAPSWPGAGPPSSWSAGPSTGTAPQPRQPRSCTGTGVSLRTANIRNTSVPVLCVMCSNQSSILKKVILTSQSLHLACSLAGGSMCPPIPLHGALHLPDPPDPSGAQDPGGPLPVGRSALH